MVMYAPSVPSSPGINLVIGWACSFPSRYSSLNLLLLPTTSNWPPLMLVYSTLTGILALIYFGGVALLHHLVNGVTGQAGQSPLIFVGSTLVIAALFQPLRRHIQWIIDRRF